MAHKDQASGNEPGQAGRPDAAVEARRSEARAAFGSAPEDEQDVARRAAMGGGAQGAMRGAVSATENIGSSLVGGVGSIASGMIGVVRDTANTAIDGVGSVGENAVHTVAGLLVEVVGGVRQIAGAAMSGMRPNGREDRERDSFRAEQASRRDQTARREQATEEGMVH